MKKNNYWEERFIYLNERLLDQGEEYKQYLAGQYEKAAEQIQKKIERFYQRFAAAKSISLAEAERLLNTEERKLFQMSLAEYIQKGEENAVDGRWIQELETASNVYHIDRLTALKLSIRQEIEILKAAEVTGLKNTLENIYFDGYYQSIYEIQKGLGYASPFQKLDTRTIEKAAVKPWAPDGKNFSDRIWRDKTKLVQILEERIPQAIIQGQGPDGIIKEVAHVMEVDQRAAARLVQTESAFIASASREDCYEELEVERFQFLATLDLLTSDICREKDRKIFDRKDYEIGVNASPLHPNCRSTTIPYFEGNIKSRTARNPITGKTETIPGNMTYQEWYEKYVASDPRALAEERKLKNRSTDQKQYEEYQKLLGKKEIGTFSEFQEKKYLKPKDWNRLKAKVQERRKGVRG